jgi:hypothetical protein
VLDSIRLGLNIGRNEDLEAVVLPALRTVGSVLFRENDRLRAVDLSGLAETGTQFTYAMNSTATGVPSYDLELPSLAGPDDFILIEDNGSLESVRLTAVTDLSVANGRIAVRRNADLTEVSAPVLTRAASLEFSNNTSLATVDLPLLEEVPSVSVSSNAALRTLDLPSLQTVASSMSLNSSPVLASVSFPSLTTLNSLSIVFADSLRNLSGFSSVTSGMQSVNIRQNASLASYTGLLNVGDALTADPIFFDIRMFNPGVCDDAAIAFRDALENKFPGDMAEFRNSISGPPCPVPATPPTAAQQRHPAAGSR